MELRAPDRRRLPALGFLVAFGTGFGYVEAAVVCYLRALLRVHENFAIGRYKVLLNLGFITFVRPVHTVLVSARITDIEVGREAATLVMLLSVALLAGRTFSQRAGAFLVAFTTWDLTYYLFLRILVDWPSSLLTRDVYFLIPVAWIGPVLTPLVLSGVTFVVGAYLFTTGAGRLGRADV